MKDEVQVNLNLEFGDIVIKNVPHYAITDDMWMTNGDTTKLRELYEYMKENNILVYDWQNQANLQTNPCNDCSCQEGYCRENDDGELY